MRKKGLVHAAKTAQLAMPIVPAEADPLTPEQHATERRRAHECHARGCSVNVPPELLMCLYHWRKVPLHIKRAVWKAYRPGQCDDMRVSREWLRAAEAAVGSVAKSEGLPISDHERKAMETFGVR